MNYIYILLQSRGGCARLVTELRATEPKLEQRFLEKFQSLMVKWRLRGFLFLHCTTPKLHEACFMLSENFFTVALCLCVSLIPVKKSKWNSFFSYGHVEDPNTSCVDGAVTIWYTASCFIRQIYKRAKRTMVKCQEDRMVEKVSKISGKLFKIQNSSQLIPASIAFIFRVIFWI